MRNRRGSPHIQYAEQKQGDIGTRCPKSVNESKGHIMAGTIVGVKEITDSRNDAVPLDVFWVSDKNISLSRSGV